MEVSDIIKKANEKIIKKLKKEAYCKHIWKPYAYGYQCKKCNYYTGLNKKINEKLKKKMRKYDI